VSPQLLNSCRLCAGETTRYELNNDTSTPRVRGLGLVRLPIDERSEEVGLE